MPWVLQPGEQEVPKPVWGMLWGRPRRRSDLSHEGPDAPLPDAVASGAQPLLVVGAMAGG